MPYFVGPESYLARARQRLDEHSTEGLFYAAFELRCGIQARLEEYVDANRDSKRRTRANTWRIAGLGKQVERMFALGNKVAEVAVEDGPTLYYTPVSRELKKMGGQLGNYLHAMHAFRGEDDAWWPEMRQLLEDVFAELRRATRGTLLGPPLLNRKTNVITMCIMMSEEDPDLPKVRAWTPGFRGKFNIQYLDRVPE